MRFLKAYAIRILQAGGEFEMRCLDGSQPERAIQIPTIVDNAIVVESNTLTNDVVPFSHVRVPVQDGNEFSPRLLWPTTTNFPTLDCF